MDRDELKQAAAEAALAYVPDSGVLGVGSGSTVALFVRALARAHVRVRAAVAASEEIAALLGSLGVPVIALASEVIPLEVYVDGADEVDGDFRLTKGGGGAHTREKVIATASRRFVCIVDESKLVPKLGKFPLPVEVVPMAIDAVKYELRALGGDPEVRRGFVTDNGNAILDVAGLEPDGVDAEGLERKIDSIPGVVECGLFARRRADVVLVATPGGVRKLER